ncbi:MAG: hypothetical protein GY930_07970 [bacterium]|nr:hypothetical protein [bacterium]
MIDHPTSLGLLLIQGALLSQRGDRDGAWNSCNRDLGAQLVRNIAPKNGHWTQVRLEETSRASTLGATLSAKADDHTMCRQVRTAESYCAASDPRIHFGLGQSKSLTSIQVTWSDGQIDSLDALVSDNIHTLRWGEGRE